MSIRNLGVTLGMVAGALGIGDVHAQGASPPSNQMQVRMQELVAAQLAVEQAIHPVAGAPQILPNRIQLERVAEITSELDVFRAILPIDHARPYLLAGSGTNVFRLGGFNAPDLTAVAHRIAVRRDGRVDFRATAERLTLLADPNGAIQSVFASTATDPEADLVTKAFRKTEADWPADTVLPTRSGTLVRITLLSKDARSFTLHWVPSAFTFQFDSTGQLLAWSMRTGSVFRASGRGVE